MIYIFISGVGFRDGRSKLKSRIMAGIGGAFVCGLPETKPVVRQKAMMNGFMSRITVQGVLTEEEYAEIRPLLRNVLMTEWMVGGPAVAAPSIAGRPEAVIREPAVDAEVLEIADTRKRRIRPATRAFANARFREWSR